MESWFKTMSRRVPSGWASVGWFEISAFNPKNPRLAPTAHSAEKIF
jgi:hypothetical protein